MTKRRTTKRSTRRKLNRVALTLVMKGRKYRVATNAPDVSPLTAVINHAERLDYEVLEARLVDATPPGYFYVYDLEDWDY